MSHFTCGCDHIGEASIVITAAGELDHLTCGKLDLALQRPEVLDAGHVVIDLSSVTFIDSSGLGVLIRAQRQAKERLPVVATQRPVLSALRCGDLTEVFTVYSTRAQAIDAAQPASDS